MEGLWNQRQESDAKPVTSQHLLLDEYLKSPRNSRLKDAIPTSERVINIEDVGKTIGSWQQKQYESLGVERIRLGTNSVSMDFKEPTKKNAIIISLSFDRNLNFNFGKNDGGWALSNVHGLKVENQTVNSVESLPGKILFHTNGNKTLEYGKGVNNFTKALFDPLMADYLRGNK